MLASALLSLACLQSDDEIRKYLDDTRIDLSFDGAKAEDLVAFLRDFSGRNIMLRGSPGDRIATIKLKDASISTCLRWICEVYGLRWEVTGGVILLSDSAGAQPVRKVHELPRRPPDPFRPEITVEKELTILNLPRREPCRHPEIIDYIRELVAPGTWGDTRTIECTCRSLIVNHLPEVQEQVARFLDSLRRLEPATLAVEAEVIEGSFPGDILDEAGAKKVRDASKPLGRIRMPAREGEMSYASSLENGLAFVLGVRAIRWKGAVRLEVDLQLGWSLQKIELKSEFLLPEAGTLLVPMGKGRAVLVGVAFAGPPSPLDVDVEAATVAPDPRVIETLQKQRLSLDQTNAALPNLIDYIREVTGVNFVIMVDRPDDRLIQVNLKDMPVARALELALDSANLTYRIEGDVVRICLRQGRNVLLANVHDLFRPDFTWYDLAGLVRESVGDDEWEADGESIGITFDGILKVRQQPRVIAEIRGLLNELRAQLAKRWTIQVERVVLDRQSSPEAFLTPVQADRLLEGADVDRVLLGFAGVCQGQDGNVESSIRIQAADREGATDLVLDINEGTNSVKTSLRVPEGRVACIELPGGNGKMRLLLLRVRRP